MSKLESLYDYNSDPSTVVAGQSITSTRRVGIEIELENIREGNGSRYWACVCDDSLRNNGMEYIFKQPFGGVDAERAIRELPSLLRNESPTRSERTSTHIHVDVRDLNTDNIKCLLVLYAACESYIYTLGGKHRYDNIYCMGLSSSQDIVDMGIDIMNAPNAGSFHRSLGRWCKYTGINLAPISTFGSVEFRMFEGYRQPHVLMGWVKAVTKLVDYAASISLEELKDVLNGDVVSSVFNTSNDVEESIVKRNKINALAIMYGKELREATLSDQASVPASDRDQIIARLTALAGA